MRNYPNALMIFAAGFGTRMGALTADRPKPLVEVSGKALIDHTLDIAAPLELERVVINTHYRAEMLKAHLSGRSVTLINEAPDILETGGGLKNALPELGKDPCFTLNSDAIWRGENPLEMLKAAWDETRMDALLLLVPKENARSHKGNGDFVLAEDGQISRGAGLMYSGAQIIRPELTSDIAESAFSLNVVWDDIARRGRLFGLAYTGHWCDVGSPDGIGLAEEMLGNDDL